MSSTKRSPTKPRMVSIRPIRGLSGAENYEDTVLVGLSDEYGEYSTRGGLSYNDIANTMGVSLREAKHMIQI